ncbi:hypothetical protein EDD29_9061 [Actinocorallia herbida]|uniref:Uncharacterized protein n=1 Tax=Actinocorallia herbida TaxID=58109 RepID=A0A3N1DDQ1_9ACTN|nr:hypothetical protein [Actinocorallia herbida]ROO91308.1 hypothetical protein EDD29_9061 [Actinocorallia herbida]
MNKKILAIAVAVAACAGAAVLAVVLLKGGGHRYENQAAMLKAVPSAAKAELGTRGQPLAGELVCESMEGASAEKLLVKCTGETTAKKPVQVFGAALAKSAREYYTILVGGRPLVKNASCLGADCAAD